jgi:hypothetical protein
VDVANRFLAEIELESEEIRESMSQYMADVHVSVNDAN